MVIKDVLIKEISSKQDIPENVVNLIVSHQFDSAHEATVNNNSIEISGFAKFIFNQKRANKQMEKYMGQKVYFTDMRDAPGISETEYRKAQMKLDTVLSNIKHLEPKLHIENENKIESDDRGLEEQPDA